jgi:integrase
MPILNHRRTHSSTLRLLPRPPAPLGPTHTHTHTHRENLHGKTKPPLRFIGASTQPTTSIHCRRSEDVGIKIERQNQRELRLKLGLGKLAADAFVFGDINGAVRDPDRITQDWKRFTAARGLPRVQLHSLRHSHASALIRCRTDPVTVSRRLGHAKATTTLSLYAHMFDHSDEAAAKLLTR